MFIEKQITSQIKPIPRTGEFLVHPGTARPLPKQQADTLAIMRSPYTLRNRGTDIYHMQLSKPITMTLLRERVGDDKRIYGK